ncbi:MAG: hypothetical protein M1163_04045 [Candidatus Thermoplasmatota archaeon]|nr:hypothetical protein [Candidatus Thermoplasmatota archaeon]
MNIFAKGLGVMAAEVVNSSKEVFKTVAQQISRITANDAEPILLPTNSRPEELDAKYVSIMRELAYSDLYRIEIGRTALRLNTSYKTAKRRMDDILRSKSIMAYPLLNQSSIEGFQIAFIYAKYEGNCSDEDFLKVLKEMPVISERYLLYRFLNGHLTMIIYYNSIGDLESSCKELEHFFPSFLLLTRFETYFNEVVTSSIAEIF